MEEVDCSLPVTTATIVSSDACPTADAIGALLENLVDPLLPLIPSVTDVPSKALRESVAKQIHAVVLLYNYYHRRDNSHLECLSLESFLNLTTVMRPALLPHLKESSEVERDGDSEQTVLLKKVIMDACSLSLSLEASTDFSSLKNWPIRKVAVLLVNSKKNSCYLQYSSITQGVWSLLEQTIEKDKTASEAQNEEVTSQKVAFAAVKEATGVNHKDIVILERHLVYSLSEEKTTARFYIMKCTSEDKFSGEFPIEEALNCMQGPLFEKSFSEWTTLPIVEYLHVLPYASLIADWFSRREDIECVIEKEAEAVCDESESNEKEDATKESEVLDIPGRGENATSKKSYGTNAKYRRKATPKIQNRFNLRGRTAAAIALKAKNADNVWSLGKETNSNGKKKDSEVESDSRDHIERKLSSIHKRNAAHVAHQSSNLNLDELQATLLSKATSVSDTALKVLLCKRDKLALQQRHIEDEIAKCDKSIENIKGNWELQLETILECCKEAYTRHILQESPDKSACQSNKRVKLCEPLPSSKTMSQKLVDVCLENNWPLPNYRVSPSDGGFKAEVRIKETKFVHPISGEVKSDAEKARDSAAACLLTRLYHKRTSQD